MLIKILVCWAHRTLISLKPLRSLATLTLYIRFTVFFLTDLFLTVFLRFGDPRWYFFLLSENPLPDSQFESRSRSRSRFRFQTQSGTRSCVSNFFSVAFGKILAWLFSNICWSQNLKSSEQQKVSLLPLFKLEKVSSWAQDLGHWSSATGHVSRWPAVSRTRSSPETRRLMKTETIFEEQLSTNWRKARMGRTMSELFPSEATRRIFRELNGHISIFSWWPISNWTLQGINTSLVWRRKYPKY